MKILVKQIGRWIMLVALIAMAKSSIAQTTITNPLDGSKNQLSKDSAVTTVDKYLGSSYAGKMDTPYLVKNVITFEINESSNIYLPAQFTATASLRIYYTKPDGTIDSVDRDLVINYDTANSYTSRANFVFNNAHTVTVKVTALTAPTGVVGALMVENTMQVFPKFLFSCTNNAIQTISSNSPSNTDSTDELVVSWPASIGADAYDLEWAYIDSSALSSGAYGSPVQTELLFKNNSTRITTPNNSFAIPLMYDNGGVLYYRVRAVQEKNNGSRIESNWSTDYSGGLGTFSFVGHQLQLNWQASTTFAEDGKHKTVVQYFDGSLRNRQTVTKDNTTNTTVVAETMYDYQGRPVIQVLPAPTLSSVIKYSRNFNVGLNSVEYDKGNYDTLPAPDFYCNSGAAQMDSSSGAYQYYSQNNSDKSGFNQYIPTAAGYPFTETEYTPDNTGRIKKQGGVGPTFKLGSGHETKYYYGTASQSDLDALFGTEVGDHSHYFKNMVRDANGQYSVSYVDMHGRTIATALAGIADSANLLQLNTVDPYYGVTVSDTLSGAGNTVLKGMVMESKQSIVVAVSDTFQFNYVLSPQQFMQKGCDSNNVCYNCLYDLKIKITDDCNNQLLPGGKAFDTTIHNFSLGQIITNCDSAKGFSFNFPLYLSPGNYEITKQLIPSETGFNYYRDSVFMVKNSCTSLDQLIAQQRLALSTVLCSYVCDTCENKTAAQSIMMGMLLDMTAPSGQYANIPDSNSTYSIFYNTSTPRVTASYTNASLQYLDENGNPDLVYSEVAGTFVKPQQLSPQEFSDKFKPSWANALLPLHPEYCKYLEYQKHAASLAWDIDFEKTNTYADAMTKGYLNPAGNSSLASKYTIVTANLDPLSTEQLGIYKDRINDSLNNYHWSGVNLWSLATINIKCNPMTSGCQSTYAAATSAFNTSTMCTADLDMAWNAFKAMYLQTKKDIIDNLVNGACATPTATTLITAGFHPNFNSAIGAQTQNGLGYMSMGGNVTTASNAMRDSLNNFYSSNCYSYAKMWAQQLSGCYDSVALSVIIPKLVQVCMEGSDSAHTMGSSSVKPSSTYAYRSFQDVLDEYNTLHTGIDKISCNAELITAPFPYDQQPALAAKTVISKPDACVCQKLNDYYTEYTRGYSGYTFPQYLRARKGVNLSDDDINTLMSLCNNTSSCNYLSQPITLPPALQCGTGEACASCKMINDLNNQFKAKYPTITPVKSPADSIALAGNTLFENYMNNRLGYSLHVWDYLTFLDTCALHVNNDYNNFAYSFQDYYFNLPVPRLSERLAFTQHFNENYSTQMSFEQIDSLYYSGNLSDYPGMDGHRSPTDIYDLQLALNDFWSYYDSLFYASSGSRPNISVDFTNYFNNYFGGEYSFYEVKQYYGLYTNLASNGITEMTTIYEVMSSFGDFAYDLMTNQYHTTYSSHAFKRYFNDCLGTNYTYGEIYGLYITDSYYGSGWFYGEVAPSIDVCTFMTGQNVTQLQSIFIGFNFEDQSSAVAYYNSLSTPKPSFPKALEDYYNSYYGDDYLDEFPRLELDDFNSMMDYIFGESTGYYSSLIGLDPTMAFVSKEYLDGPTLCGKAAPVFTSVDPNTVNNCSDSSYFINSVAYEQFKAYADSTRGSFGSNYYNKCLQAMNYESFTVTHKTYEYHYTLYYYDQAGNLVKTVAPSGVVVDRSPTWLGQVAAARKAGQVKTPAHTFATDYRYNSLNQVVAQKTPDAATSKFWYDGLDRLSLSQNAKQATPNQYSYTLYDPLGRIIEVGRLASTTSPTSTITRNPGAFTTWWNAAAGSKAEITKTFYDQPYAPLTSAMSARNLRNRVAWSATFDNSTNTDNLQFLNATYYSYDIHGNVDTLLQDFRGTVMDSTSNRFKKIVYRYDLVSGKVNHVAYQPGSVDAFYHRYNYDAENRITSVEVSSDSIYWEKDAIYQYYKHGPLARTIIGQQQVQGIDYAYTLQGWLKGVNSTVMTPTADMGHDGQSGSMVAKDAFGFTLHYYGDNRDYTGIGTSANPFIALSSSMSGYNPLFNGNIAGMTTAVPKLGGPILNTYTYDVLNRIRDKKTSSSFNGTTNAWTTTNSMNDYQESFDYDANGNIQKLLRYGNPTQGNQSIMDSLNYMYTSGTNKLDFIKDNVAATSYGVDIDDQPINNYGYDAIGNLTKDSAEHIRNINWTTYGKIQDITKTDGTVIKYTYDASGNRISKTYVPATGVSVQTFYVRDATGNVMSIYSAGDTVNNGKITQTEIHLYGSSRLGIFTPNNRVDTTVNPVTVALIGIGTGTSTGFTRGRKVFELGNHLGNVLASISDRKMQRSSNGTTVSYYDAAVTSANDYYAFGMLEPGRGVTGSSYRYGFNGKEHDNSINTDDYNFGGRIYDARTNVWLSIDPLQKKRPGESPYLYSGANPIIYVDPDGKDRILCVKVLDEQTGKTLIIKVKLNDDLKSTLDRNYMYSNDHWYSGSGYTDEYKWHDINMIMNVTIAKDGKVTTSMHEELGKVRATTWFDAEWTTYPFVKYKGETKEGGIMFTTSSPDYNWDNELEPGSKHFETPVNVDGIISAFGAAAVEGSELKKATKVVSILEKIRTAKYVGDAAADASDKLGVTDVLKDAIDKMMHSKDAPYQETKKKTDVCPVCGVTTDSGHVNTTVRRINNDQTPVIKN
jgi:RHS repeat-associated protein